MTFQTSSNDLLTPTKYLVSSTASEGKFTTIQAAITQATADGASATDQAIILIKPGQYTEDLTLADGIVLKGLNSSFSVQNFNDDSSVQITGDHSLSSGVCWMEDITLLNSGSEAISFSGGTIYMKNCYVEVANAECIELTGATNKNLALETCLFNPTGTGTFISFDGSNTTVKITTHCCGIFNDTTTSTFSGANGTIQWKGRFDVIEHSFTLNNPTVALSFKSSSFSSTNTFFTTGASATGTIDCDDCLFNSATVFDIGNTALKPRISGTATSYLSSSFQNSQEHSSIELINGTPAEFVRAKGRTGYLNAESRNTQGWVQTTDATATTIWSKTLDTNQGITIFATISGKKSDSSAYCGGDVVGCARRAGAGAILVGTTSRVYEDSGGAPTFAINVNGNDVRIQVTGIAAETWNWASNINFQLIETNS